jgi:hypothetical protein
MGLGEHPPEPNERGIIRISFEDSGISQHFPGVRVGRIEGDLALELRDRGGILPFHQQGESEPPQDLG